ncbi:MAG: histidine kinase [Bacteroidota bacterium]
MFKLTNWNIFYNFLIWSIVAMFTATQLYLKAIQSGEEQSWIAVFKIQLLVWWIWGVITPFIFWLGNKLRIDKRSFLRGLIIHLPIALIIVVSYLAMYAIVWLLGSYGSINVESFRNIFIILFLNLFHWHLFIYMAIIGIVHARLYYIESRNRALRSLNLEKQLLVGQLNLLKMQLQPHFLFNTLNSIVSSIHQKKTDVAASMTTELSELLRISLAGSDKQVVSLKQELHHVKTYLNIEKHRFKDLEVNYQIPENVLGIEVPNFFLQPVVENAIKHGISKKSAANFIELTATQYKQAVCFTVYNEGPPFSTLKEGIGLSNIKKRLKAMFGEEGILSIQSEREGVLVSIEIPVS